MGESKDNGEALHSGTSVAYNGLYTDIYKFKFIVVKNDYLRNM